jgi:hypothetical protein
VRWEVDEGVGDYARVRELIARQPATDGDGGGVLALLRRLCGAATGELSASGAGVSMMAEGTVRGVTAASDPTTERIEELHLVLGEGPGVDAFADRRPVLVPDLRGDARSRWPVYTPALSEFGVRAVFAFPLQVGAARLGVFEVFRAQPGQLSSGELGSALTFAEVAVNGLLDGQEKAPAGSAADGLEKAVERRGELYQAQGMVMVQLGVGLIEALVRIRAHSYAQDRNLNDVAADIIARKLRFDPERPEAR